MKARAEASSDGPAVAERQANGRRRALGALFLLVTAAASIPCAYSAHAALAFNPIKLPLEKQARAPYWLPQGWKFFTRDPKEEREAFYRRTPEGAWVSAAGGANAEPSHGFGLSRAARAQGVEFGLLVQPISQNAFQACEESPLACLERAEEALSIKNESPLPTLCGSIGIVMQKPIPWAWAGSADTIIMPSRVVRVRVSC